ncbi:protein farnesyltransferase/geranylgeranyltransferase type-1 subunit alpha-like [Lolium perenne]|uniref:protein farnesyltransferase/geranylgeranyltransferase type-1 subunit alpha-like n=1 Tax=Lolium perenne TaxID=4522 RepID=UPI0021F56685|nr:protein farnesyltransferase/geranylgeranyltransferase type-1 subunit alpha-like [Lolium perenne]
MATHWTACRSRRRGLRDHRSTREGGPPAMASSSGEEDGARMSAGARELADMAPVPLSDRACPVVSIACRGFRAFYVDGKCCARALCLTVETIYGSTSSPHLNNTIWYFRRVVLEALV